MKYFHTYTAQYIRNINLINNLHMKYETEY